MRSFKNLPIKWKLMLAMMATSLTAILLLGSALFFAGLLHLRNLEVQKTAALAEIVGGYCTGSLAREDAAAAQRALSNVAANGVIEDACLYTIDGRLLARYTRRDLAPEPPPKLAMPGESFAGDRLNLYRHVRQDGIVTGTIYLRANTWLMWARLKSYVGTGAVVMGLSMLVALIFANRLQRFFSTPIAELARVAEAITTKRDFTQRATKLSEDETGLLTEAFNKMLAIIQEHDSGSRASQSRLEKRIAERTVELRRVNEALRESEERFRTVFEQATDGFLLADVKTKQFSLSNPRMSQMLGYTADEIKTLSVKDIHPSQDLSWIVEMFARQAAGETNMASEVPVLRKDRSIFYADISARSLEIDSRSYLLGIFRDTTGRKEAKEDLQRRLETERFVASASSRLANAATQGLEETINEVLAGLGRITQTDRSFLFSVSDDFSTADNTHEWCEAGVQSHISELRNVPTAKFPWYFQQLRSGEPLLVSRAADFPAEAVAEKRLLEATQTQSVILVPIRHGGTLVGFIGCDAVRGERQWSDEEARLLRIVGELITNTQARLRVSEILRDREGRLQAVLENSLDVAYRRNLRTNRYDFFSPAAEQATGFPAQELMGKDLEFVRNRIHPNDLAASASLLEKAQTGEVTSGIIEYRFKHKNGNYRWFSDRFQVVKDDDGRPLYWVGVSRDVTEQKEMEDALRRSETNLQIALDAAELGPWHWNIVTGELSWSPQCLALYGLPSNTSISYDRFLGSVHPDDRERVREALREAVENRSEYMIEKRVILPDGSTRWTASQGHCSYDEAGQPLRMDGVSYDITKRKEAEQALLESEDRYRSLFASSLDAALLATADGRILAANPAACRMFGMSEAELIMVGRYGLVDLSDSRLRPAMEERNRTGRFYGELTFIRRDGTKFEGEIASVIIPTQTGDDRASVVIRDITDRKRAEAALAKSRSMLLETEKIGNVGGWEFDIDTKQQVWTEEVYRIHEVDLTYKPTVEEGIHFYTPASRPIIARAVQRAIEHGEPFDVELEITTARGNLRQVHAIGKADLEHRRVFGFFQDISARKQAEEALRRLNETLEQRVAERTEALRVSEERFRRHAEHLQDVLYSVDKETREFRYVSPAFERVFGYTADDIRNMGGRVGFLKQVVVESAMSIDEQQRRLERLTSQPEAGVWFRDEEWWRCKSGTLKCVEDRWIPVYESGRLVSTEGLLCDITDHKRAEEALRGSEERYHSLINNLNVGVYRNTFDGRFLEANPALARIHGFESVNELLNTRVVDIYQDPVDRQVYLADLSRAGSVTGYELRLKKKDGTLIYCSVTATAHRAPDGSVDWVDGILEDITERKRLEDQLLEISEREQRRIGQDLHDGLCQHLAGVGFMSKALAQKLAVTAPTEAADARTVANLIRQAISEARSIATGLHPVKKEPNATMVTLQELATNIEGMFRVHCTFTCDPPVLIEDNNAATHIYRIAQEAVNNALRHGKARNIWITLADANRRVTLTVKDDGKGIPQSFPATRGIGIDIMTHRARVIGGTFHIGRAPEGGTVLTCSFPNLPAT